MRSRHDAAGAGHKHLCCRWRLLLRPWWNEKGSGNRVRRNGGRWTFPATAVRHKPIAAATFCKRRARMGCRTRTSPPRPREPGPPDAIDRPAIGAVSVSASAVGRQGMARLRIHAGGWCLVPGGFESFASVSIHRSDRLPPPCSSSATTVAATSPPRTRRDARKATRSVQRPWWPTSRRGSCSLISTYSYMAEKKGLPYRCLALPFCASIGRARECVVGSRLGFETWPRTKSGAREGSPFGSFPPTPNAMMRLCAFRTDPARRGMFVCFDVSRSNRCGHGVVVVGRWTR